jgi:hypothetical protein
MVRALDGLGSIESYEHRSMRTRRRFGSLAGRQEACEVILKQFCNAFGTAAIAKRLAQGAAAGHRLGQEAVDQSP